MFYVFNVFTRSYW